MKYLLSCQACRTARLLILNTIGLWFALPAQAQFKLPQAKISDERFREFVLIHATLVAEPGKKLENATIHVKNGQIVAAGTGIPIPEKAEIRDLQGAWVYPSFIDLFSTYGLKPSGPTAFPSSDHPFAQGPVYDSRKPGAFVWNQAMKPEFNASSMFQANPKEAGELRKLGFGYVLSGSRDGIMRGSSCLVQLGEGSNNELILKNAVLQGLSFQKGSSPQIYPGSQMGAIALLRQTFLDAIWYQKARNKEVNLGLEAINQSLAKTWLFETQQKYEVLRAAAIAKEYQLKLLIKGSGDEYQRAAELKETGFPLILPLQFPEMPDVEDPLDASQVSVADLKHWELAPYNASILAGHQIPFAFTSSDLKDPKTFLAVLRKTVDCGLHEDEALAALTTRPASFAGMDGQLGRIKPGFGASFFVATGNIFKGNSQIVDHYVLGNRFVVSPDPGQEKFGNFRLQLGSDTSYRLTVSSKDGKNEFIIQSPDGKKTLCQGSLDNGKINFTGILPKLDSTVRLQFTGWTIAGGYKGWFVGLKSGKSEWKTIGTGPANDTVPAPKAVPNEKPGEVWYPFQAFGAPKAPNPLNTQWLIRNATLFTNEPEGVLKETDVLLSGGKIQAIGRKLRAPAGAGIIDATGKYVTAGIVDEHSHIAISKGVNEGSSTTSMEVRIGDVIEADDVNIYRHLAGGVTTVQQLHGSANTIGGQSSLIKLKWGKNPAAMKIPDAPGFIKFALGENVKQSNWGDQNVSRYPQTRMGVEQLLYDAFGQARKYREEKAMMSKRPDLAFHTDLKMETLVEILEKKRFITCHSYVQSEINMLMHVADSLGFTVNTFTHILEGYKVADKMKKHGAGASTFSDWWAYKMEVKDAIPYNAALMHQHGVLVAINSDDAEMATRLNQEAAKTIKYGGVSEEDAWKMVTLNPARLLHLDHRLGSLKAGKDADIVIWSANPLHISAMAEKTFVDGEKLFDLESDKMLQESINTERQRIIQKILKAKQGGAPVVPVMPKTQHLWHCDDLGEF